MAALVVGAAGYLLAPVYLTGGHDPYEPPHDALLRAARRIAYCLYMGGGARPICADTVMEPAKTKSLASRRQTIPAEEVRLRFGVPEEWLGAPGLIEGVPDELTRAILDPQERGLRLMTFERRDNFFAATFAYGDPAVGAVPSIPGNGPLLYGVVLRASFEANEAMAASIMRAISDLPLIREVVLRPPGVWRFALVDFQLNGTHGDAVAWVEANKAELALQGEARARERFKELNKDPELFDKLAQEAERLARERIGDREKQALPWAQDVLRKRLSELRAFLEERSSLATFKPTGDK